MSVDALTRDIDKLTDNFYRSENKAKVGVCICGFCIGSLYCANKIEIKAIKCFDEGIMNERNFKPVDTLISDYF